MGGCSVRLSFDEAAKLGVLVFVGKYFQSVP